MQKSLSPPRAERRPVSATHHGHTRTDDYAWLRAENWQEVMRDPAALPADIRAYLEAENAYFAAQMADTEALQEALFEEMRGRIKEDDSTVPAPDGPWAYATRYVEGGQHPLYVREPREGGAEKILLDGNALADGRAYFRIGGGAHSPDHRLLAWSHDDAGSEFYHALGPRPGDRPRSRRRHRRHGRLGGLVGRRPISSSMSGSTPTTGRRASSATRSAPAARPTCWSTRSRIPASSSASARRSRTASS